MCHPDLNKRKYGEYLWQSQVSGLLITGIRGFGRIQSMPDVFTRKKRSEVMSKVRSRGNRDTELVVASLFRKHRITGWRRHLPLPGRPDFAFRDRKLALFIDGCFWHGCPRHYSVPKGNAAFWRKKFLDNRARDRRVTRELRKAGWTTLRVWEHQLRDADRVIAKVRAGLKPRYQFA